MKVIDILLDYVKTQNDRNERILEFHHPEDMKQLLDLDLPESALPLQQLIQDCARTMKYQVRTGKYDCVIFIENFIIRAKTREKQNRNLVKFNLKPHSMNDANKKINKNDCGQTLK